MKFEKIERAFHLLLENVQNIQNALGTNFYDALIEQNGIYLDGDTDLQEILKNNCCTTAASSAVSSSG